MALVGALLAVPFLGLLWAAGASLELIAGASVMSTRYFLWFAPADCRARTRGCLPCRNNAKGLLRACHIQQHKRQKSRRLVYFGGERDGSRVSGWWRENRQGLWSTPRQIPDTIGAIASIGSVAATLVGAMAASLI